MTGGGGGGGGGGGSAAAAAITKSATEIIDGTAEGTGTGTEKKAAGKGVSAAAEGLDGGELDLHIERGELLGGGSGSVVDGRKGGERGVRCDGYIAFDDDDEEEEEEEEEEE